MIQKIVLTVSFFVILLNISAQKEIIKGDTVKADTVKYWKKGGFSSLTFNQVSLSDWKAGGENAFSTTAILNLYGNYKKGKVTWDNSLDLGYGRMKNEGKKMRKNEDKIDLTSKLGYKAFGKVYYSTLFNYRTQFDKGFNYPNDSVPVSRFNAPGYITIGVGLDYKPASYLSVSLSPATGKFTVVMDKTLSDSGAYSVERGKNLRPEFGANLNAKFQKDIAKKVSIVSKLLLFNNYTDRDKPNRKNVDINWEIMINIKAGKFLTTNILTNLIYDQNAISRYQLKEVLGVGLSYKI